MGLIDREHLLLPISDSEPSGPDLEHDPAFLAFELSATGKPERRMGDAVIAGEPPDWAAVEEQGLQLLERTHDLRVAVKLVRALLERHGYPGLNEGLALVQAMLETFWSSVHPELDHEENDDPMQRISALSELGQPAFVFAVRTVPLFRTRAAGAVSLRDLQEVAGEGGEHGAESGLSPATLEAAFQEVELSTLEGLLSAIKQCTDSLLGIDRVFEQHTGSRGPELAPLLQVLRQASNALVPRLAARQPAPEAAARASAEAEAGGPSALPGPARAEAIRSREEVVQAIDQICAYYARYEPGSPLPLLLERCRRLVHASFLDIIRDLVPDSVGQIERLAGRPPE